MKTIESASRQELTRVLESMSGRSIRSRADVRRYLAEVPASSPRSVPRKWMLARRATLAAGLVLAFLQYYLIDIYVQIMSLPSITLGNPTDAKPAQQSMLALLRLFT